MHRKAEEQEDADLAWMEEEFRDSMEDTTMDAQHAQETAEKTQLTEMTYEISNAKEGQTDNTQTGSTQTKRGADTKYTDRKYMGKQHSASNTRSQQESTTIHMHK